MAEIVLVTLSVDTSSLNLFRWNTLEWPQKRGGSIESLQPIYPPWSMVSAIELGTPVNTTVLEDSLMSANRNVIDLLGRITHIAIPSPVM